MRWAVVFVAPASRRLSRGAPARAVLLLLPSHGFFFFRLLILTVLSQSLQHRSHDQRQPHRSIHEYLAKFSALSRRHKLPPRNRFAIGTARQPAPIDRLGTDPQPVVVAFQGNVFTHAPVPQLDERSKLLRPVPRHTAAYGKDPQP